MKQEIKKYEYSLRIHVLCRFTGEIRFLFYEILRCEQIFCIAVSAFAYVVWLGGARKCAFMRLGTLFSPVSYPRLVISSCFLVRSPNSKLYSWINRSICIKLCIGIVIEFRRKAVLCNFLQSIVTWWMHKIVSCRIMKQRIFSLKLTHLQIMSRPIIQGSIEQFFIHCHGILLN
jgi:hypothetical protein